MAAPLTVQLRRNDAMTSWGFRLQGGTDFRAELSVKKVAPNTPAAQAGLNSGDAIVAINNYDTRQMTHGQASQIIKSSGNVLTMHVHKGHGGMSSLLKPTGPVKFSQARASQFKF